MACDRCITVIREMVCIGKDVECSCDYCGYKFIAGKPEQCITCDHYISKNTDDGYRYICQNDDADCKKQCSGYQNESEGVEEDG